MDQKLISYSLLSFLVYQKYRLKDSNELRMLHIYFFISYVLKISMYRDGPSIMTVYKTKKIALKVRVFFVWKLNPCPNHVSWRMNISWIILKRIS